MSELIYWDNYHLDSSGTQIYDVNVTSQALAYSDNDVINAAFEIMRQSLTLEEIYSLTAGANVAVINKITPLLSAEQIAAIQNMSYEELKDAVTVLVARAESEGAGGYADEVPDEVSLNEDASAAETSAPAETTTPAETTAPKDDNS